MLKYKVWIGIMLVLCVAALVTSFFFYLDAENFLGRSATAPGTITKIDVDDSDDSTTYNLTVSFQVPNKGTFLFVTHGKSSDRVGQKVTVRYDQNNVNRAYIGTNKLYDATIGFILIAVFFAADALVFFLILRNKQYKAWLLQNGRRVMAFVQDVKVSKGYDGEVYRVFLGWTNPETHQNFSFRSPTVMTDPRPYLRSVGEMAEVIIDPRNPMKYIVDTKAWLATPPKPNPAAYNPAYNPNAAWPTPPNPSVPPSNPAPSSWPDAKK